METLIKNFTLGQEENGDGILLSAEVIVKRSGKFYEVPIKMLDDPSDKDKPYEAMDFEKYLQQFIHMCGRLNEYWMVSGKYPCKEYSFE